MQGTDQALKSEIVFYLAGSWKQSLPPVKLLANNTHVYGTTGETERGIVNRVKRKNRNGKEEEHRKKGK